jgi:3-methyladenine DNA glycosylase AlkD
MLTGAEILADLQSKGKEKTRVIYARHNIPYERTWGVSNADLKLIARAIHKEKGREQALAAELYASGNYDAMYLAGLVANGAKMSRAELQAWAEAAEGIPPIAEHPIAWLATEHLEGWELARTWIASPVDELASAGWATFSGLMATQPDDALNLVEVEALLKSVPGRIGKATNRARYTMNNFVMAVGIYVAPLRGSAKAVAQQMGAVSVNMGETACEVPLATAMIEKAVAMGKTAKRKTIRC